MFSFPLENFDSLGKLNMNCDIPHLTVLALLTGRLWTLVLVLLPVRVLILVLVLLMVRPRVESCRRYARRPWFWWSMNLTPRTSGGNSTYMESSWF